MRVDPVAKKRAFELEQLAGILERQRLAENPNELRRAAAALRDSVRDGTYSYSFDKVYFSLSNLRHALPHGVTSLRAELRVRVHGLLDEDAEDQFVNLATVVVLTGVTKSGTAMFSWHLDRDAGAADTVDLHPRYHFQHAGQTMRGTASDWGLSLFLDPPRIMHPPLDGLLAVDFVLGAYSAGLYKDKCLKDPAYVRLMSAAQKRNWSGFARAISTFSTRDVGWHARCSPYWPQVLPG